MKTSSRTAIAVVTLSLVLALHSCSDYFLFKEPPPQQEVTITPDPPLTPDPPDPSPSITLTVSFDSPQGTNFVNESDVGVGGHYQDVVTMTVTKKVGGVVDPSWTGPVTWTVTSLITDGGSHYGNHGSTNPPTDPPNNPPDHTLTTGNNGTDYGVWQRPLDHKAGLAWLAAPTDPVDGTTNWSANGDNILNIPGETSAPTGTTVHLADIVGSRTITVKATEGGATSTAVSFTFGDGPLSVFTKTSGGSTMQWGNTNTAGFTNASTQFPAAIFCGGTIGNIGTTMSTGSIFGFSFPVDGGNWSTSTTDHQHFWGSFQQPYTYAEKSKLPTAEQLFAVATYNVNVTHLSTVQRKGAALAANWDTIGLYWSGEMRFTGDYYALNVLLGNGEEIRLLLRDLSRVAGIR